MIKGFKEFILRGNVIDLAVAVVIGAAFTLIVNAIVAGLINPLIALIFQADSLNGVVWTVTGHVRQRGRLRLRCDHRRDHQLPRGRGRGVLRVRLPDEPGRRSARPPRPASPKKRPRTCPTEQELLLQIRDLLASQGTAPRVAERRRARPR